DRLSNFCSQAEYWVRVRPTMILVSQSATCSRLVLSRKPVSIGSCCVWDIPGSTASGTGCAAWPGAGGGGGGGGGGSGGSGAGGGDPPSAVGRPKSRPSAPPVIAAEMAAITPQVKKRRPPAEKMAQAPMTRMPKTL